MSALPPIHREVVVDADPATAFEVFTQRIDRWWPLSELSIFGDGASVAFRDGVLVETAADGRSSTWGTITEWSPPDTVAFTWHPGGDESRATRVSVRFIEFEGRTLVVLEHAGWEHVADPARGRTEYDEGWPTVLARYAEHVHGSEPAPVEPEDADYTWVALLHRPKAAGNVFADPRFAEHLAFLDRRRAAGQLVAAGPLGDAEGEGMTVLRLIGRDQLAQAEQLARTDDRSVAEGLFEVSVRPWNVVLSVP